MESTKDFSTEAEADGRGSHSDLESYPGSTSTETHDVLVSITCDWRHCSAVRPAGGLPPIDNHVQLPKDLLSECSSIDVDLEELFKQVPQDENGKRFSIGSVGHNDGYCKAPCVFAQRKKGCKKGLLCDFCHYDHNLAKRSSHKRKMKAKAARAALKVESETLAPSREMPTGGLAASHSIPIFTVPSAKAHGPLLLLSSCPPQQHRPTVAKTSHIESQNGRHSLYSKPNFVLDVSAK